MGVRLVSGDHIATAKAVALKAKILRADEAASEYAVMDAAHFRSLVGGLVLDQAEGGVDTTVEFPD